jgi:hypothetical protein
MGVPLENLSETARSPLAATLDGGVTEFAKELSATFASYEPGVSTVVAELERGGREGTQPPLPDPHGYDFSLRYLSPEILSRAAVL